LLNEGRIWRKCLPPPTAAIVTAYAVNLVSVLFEEIRYIQEAVPFQSQIHECALHAGQYARYAAFVNASREGVLVGPLQVDLYQLAVFDNPDLRFVAVLTDHQFLGHHLFTSMR